MPAPSLKAVCDSVLANLEALYASAPEGSVGSLPELRYVSPGPFAAVAPDCEQAVVTLEGVTRGAPGGANTVFSGPVMAPLHATISIAVWRECMPVSEDESPPPAEAQDEAAARTLADLSVMWPNAKALLSADNCRHHSLIVAQLLPVQGAVGGSRIVGDLDLTVAG